MMGYVWCCRRVRRGMFVFSGKGGRQAVRSLCKVFGYDRNRFKRFVTENREHADGDERHILSEWLFAITGR